MWTLPCCGRFCHENTCGCNTWLSCSTETHIYCPRQIESPIQLYFSKLLQNERGRGKRLETLSLKTQIMQSIAKALHLLLKEELLFLHCSCHMIWMLTKCKLCFIFLYYSHFRHKPSNSKKQVVQIKSVSLFNKRYNFRVQVRGEFFLMVSYKYIFFLHIDYIKKKSCSLYLVL